MLTSITNPTLIVNYLIITLVILTYYLISEKTTTLIILFTVEAAWCCIFTSFVLFGAIFCSLSLHMTAIVILVISAVELVTGLLLFVIYHQITKSLVSGSPLPVQQKNIKSTMSNSSNSLY